MGRDSGRKVLVTGGAGFIGSHLVDRLLGMGDEVTVLDDLSSGCKENLNSSAERMRFVKGNIRNLALVKKLVKDSDLVFHLAEFIPNTDQFGPGHVIKFSMKRPLLDLDICVRGTLNLLEAAKETETKVVFASTAAVYGNALKNPIREDAPIMPISPYGVSKAAAEMYCDLYHRIHELPMVIVRFFNVYGPRQRKYLMYDTLRKLAENSKELTVLGSGKQQRDFVYVDDVVNGLMLLSGSDKAIGGVFNLGTGEPSSVEDVVACMTETLGLKPTISYSGSSWKGDIDILVADISKIEGLGFSAKHNLAQGIKKLVEWFRERACFKED